MPVVGRTLYSDLSLSLQNIHPVSYSMGTGVLARGKKWPERVVKNKWSCACSPLIRLRSMDRDSMIFTLTRLPAAEAFILPSP